MRAIAWAFPPQHIWRTRATADDIDMFGHVNNTRYVAWAMDCAWSHSQALGLSFEDYERIGAGYVVRRHEFDYVASAMEGDDIAVATAIVEAKGKVQITRAFDLRRLSDGAQVAAGRTNLVCIDMKTARPRRAPDEFVAAYISLVKESG